MTRKKINLCLEKLDKGLSLYCEGIRELDILVSEICGGSITDIVGDDGDRQDNLLAIADGISASADDVIEWSNEFKKKQQLKS